MITPVVVGDTLGAFFCRSGTSIIGYYTPFMLFLSITMPVCEGLITTLSLTTDFARLFLYTGSSGFASGVTFNAPITAVQTVFSSEDVSPGLSSVLFAQHFGFAVSIVVAQVVFTNELSSNLTNSMSNVTATDIGKCGLERIIDRAPPGLQIEVCKVISRSLTIHGKSLLD